MLVHFSRGAEPAIVLQEPLQRAVQLELNMG